jgi:hypothetical protein
MLDVVRGKHRCRREGCRRIVRIHEVEVKEKLASDKVLLEYVCTQKINSHRFNLHLAENIAGTSLLCWGNTKFTNAQSTAMK